MTTRHSKLVILMHCVIYIKASVTSSTAVVDEVTAVFANVM